MENNAGPAKTCFYRHYKNKPYKFLGIVRHSESLEELVLYETLYKNENSQFWVRPKEMFFEMVKISDKLVHRFKPIDINFVNSHELTNSILVDVKKISESILTKFNQDELIDNLKNNLKPFLQVAYDEDLAVGFQAGFGIDEENFFTWSTGILPNYRSLGLGTSFMNQQYEWCKKNGFKRITKSLTNEFPEVLSFNLKSGFEIIGTRKIANEPLALLFERKIT